MSASSPSGHPPLTAAAAALLLTVGAVGGALAFAAGVGGRARWRRGCHSQSPSAAAAADGVALSADAIVSPRSNSALDTAAHVPLHTPTPSRPPVPAFTAASFGRPLPAGVHLRTARREDQSALAHLLRCVAATQRGGLAREVDEVSDEYVRAMIDALEGGVMILAMAVPGSSAVPESDPCSPASLSPSPPPSSSSPSSSSSCCFEVSLTASCGHVLVGVLKVSPMGPHRCFRHVLTDCTLAVHPHWQRRGIAQHLFAALFARLAEPTMAHVLRVELVARETNRHAVAMYERVGFRVNARLHGRIVTGMPLHLQRNAKEQEQQPSQQDSPPELPTCDVASLRFESDIVMVWFNPAFDERALAAQFDAPAAQSANTNSCAQ